MKKAIASVGLAVAATAGAFLLTGPSASAQTTQTPARADVAYVQTSAVAYHHPRPDRGHRWGYDRGYGWGHHRHHPHHWNRHFDVDVHRITISSANTDIAVDD